MHAIFKLLLSLKCLMFYVVWKWFKFPDEFFMPIHNLAFIKKNPLQLCTLQKFFGNILDTFFPSFLFLFTVLVC